MNWQAPETANPYSRIVGMDPFADWLLGPAHGQFAHRSCRQEQLIPFLFAPFDEAALSLLELDVMRRLASDGIKVVAPHLSSVDHAKPGDYVVLFAQKQFFVELATSNNPPFPALRAAKKHIKLGLPLHPNLRALPENPPWELADPPLPAHQWPAGTVVVGIIDDGIAFAHERFRAKDGKTRVQFFWRQDGPYEDNSTVDFGREICKESLGTRKGIDELLSDCTTAGLVDEDQLYREAKLIDFSLPEHKAAAFNLAHGTHVLDLAAGYNPASAPDNRPIIAVQLPVAATADTSGSGLEVYAKVAIDYILDRARRLSGKGPPLPVVINFSYGTIAGPHDGTAALEAAMDKAIQDARARGERLNIVLPAGNSHLSRCHAEVTFKQSADKTILNWRVQPEDFTMTQMEIWMPQDGAEAPKESRIRIRIKPPWGEESLPVEEAHGDAVQLVKDGQVLAMANYSFMPAPTGRGVFCISLLPTAQLQPPERGRQDAVAPSGLWQVEIENLGLQPQQTIHAWIQRDDVIYGYPKRGRQSYFDAPCYLRFDPISGEAVADDHEHPPCRIKRRGLINAIATGNETIVIGGVYRKEDEVVEYSAGGPTQLRHGSRDGPDALAVSDDSRIHRGVIAAGSRSGSVAIMNGTSVAAPQITRKAADEMAQATEIGKPADRPFDRQSIIQLASRTPGSTEPTIPLTARPLIVRDVGRIITPQAGRLPRIEADP